MLDWSKIDNDKVFQRLVNDLFFLECPSSFGFSPFSPYIGKDSGWDGSYTGLYPSENIQGKFCIQAKCTMKSFNDAMASLKAWIKRELENAQKNNVEHLRLATRAELRKEHLEELENVDEGTVKTFKIWHRELLDLRINQQPFLRYTYFGRPSIPLFVPPSIYFRDSRDKLIDKRIFEIKTIQDRLSEFEAFLRDDIKVIFVIHAFGGHGKSHFLREIPSVVHSIEIDREVWFIKDGVRDVREAFNDEIGSRESYGRRHKYLFVLDDADRADDVKELVSCIIKSGIDAKLVMSLRTAGKFSIEEELISLRCMSFTTVTFIDRWTDEELKLLLRTVAEKDKIDNDDDIVRQYPNPFFIVAIGQKIKGQTIRDITNVIHESILSDSKKALSSEQIDVEDLLLHLALISPINISASTIITKLAQRLNIEEKKLVKILKRLDEVGIMRSIGNILRFTPDMVGDIFLLEKMKKMDKQARKDTFLYWFDTHSRNIFCNLGATLMYGGKQWLPDIVSDVISGWINNANKYDEYEKRRILENLETICFFIPDKALDLLWVFFDCSNLSTDAYGPIILRLIRSDCSRDNIVKIIEGMREKVKEGTYSNYKFDTLAQETVTPIRNSIDKIMKILEIVKNSLKNNERIVEFATAALQEVLASAHEHRQSTYKGMTIGPRVLKVTDAVLNMRSRAIDIVKTMLLDNRISVRLSAIEIIDNIGKGFMGAGAGATPLEDRIIEEKKNILDFIKFNNLIDKENDWGVLSSYEDLLFVWWGGHKDVPDDKVVPLLCKFAYGPEYRIYRYYSSRWDVADNVLDKLKDAPQKKGRWKWAVDNIMQKKWNLTIDDFEKDAEFLIQKYPTPHDIVSFLNNLIQKVTISSVNALFLRAWFKQSPDEFKKIREDKNLWNQVPMLFKYTITYDLVQKFPDMAERIIKEDLLSTDISLDEAKIAINILSYDLPSVNRYEIVKIISEKNIDELNLMTLQMISSIRNEIPAQELVELVSPVLNHLSHSTQPQAIEHIAFFLHGKNVDYIKTFFEGTHSIIRSILLHDGKLDYHDFEISSLLFTDIKELMGFVKSRLEKEKEIDKYKEYEAVPYDGVMFIDKVIKNNDDFLYAITQLLKWSRDYRGISNCSVEILFKQVVLLKDSSGKLYFENIKEVFYNKSNFLDLVECLFHIPLFNVNITIFDEAIHKSKETGFEIEMCKLLRSKIYPEEGWSSEIGETPPAFLEKKEVFMKLREKAPAGILRNTLDECVQGIVRMIEDHKRDEANRFYSR
ncbi:MAG: hypothetical protein JRI96_12175 [Deltaproteobacteria bacterium]|nr:hypothetical protein [Deltaproteobacteria bacterium]